MKNNYLKKLDFLKRSIRYLPFLIFGLFFIMPLFFLGAPFNSSSRKKVRNMIDLASVKKDEKAADLGSGDGRIIISLAQAGAEAYGYEINPLLVWYSRQKIKKAGLSDLATIKWQNFWNVDLSSFDIITVFQIDISMKKLERKLKSELKSKARVVSNYWTFPTWLYRKSKGQVYLYEQD